MCGEMSLDHHLDLLIPNLIFNFTVWDLFTERNKNMKIVAIAVTTLGIFLSLSKT